MNNITEVKRQGRRIYAKWVYNLTYDPQRKVFTCECESFIFRGRCRHIERFKEILEGMNAVQRMAKNKRGVEKKKNPSRPSKAR